jgi:alkanesulfonate monooxygenase SsuD/methylene tetrahydromethanopterin reductase-like flavin-dependent oxidoreductase (luciferase family)
MKFGLFVNSQQPRDDDPVLRFRQCVQQVIVARDNGFDAIAAGHHYVSPPYIAIQNLPFLARLSAESGNMDLVLAVTLLALLNPVQTAEEIASLDVMSEGRVVFGVGIGYREEEFQAFGLQVSDRVPRMLEGLRLIKRLWTEDKITHQGRFFNLREATSTIRPVQRPHPPIWIAANADKAVERTGRLGYPWFINPHAAMPTTERQWGLYKDALAANGHQLPAARPMILELHVAATREEAVATAQPYLEGKYAAYAAWGQDKVLPGQESFRVSFDELAKDRFILGSPQDVIEQLETRIARLDANYFIFRAGWPGMEMWKILKVLELMGKEVLPYFHKKYGRGL